MNNELSPQQEIFIRLRAEGVSFDKISEKIEVSKPTLLKWSVDYSEDITREKFYYIQEMLSEYNLHRKQRIEKLLKLLDKVNTAFENKDLENENLLTLLKMKSELESDFKNILDNSYIEGDPEPEKWEIEKREGMGFVIRHLDRGAGPGYFLSKVSLPLPCVFSCQMRADYPAVEKKGAGFGMGMARVHEKLDAWPPDRRKMRWTGSCLGIEKGAKSCGFAKWDRWQMRLRKENDNVVAEVRCAAEGKSPGPWKSLKEDYGVDVPDVDTHTALGAVGFYAKDLTCEFRELELYSSSRDE